MHCIFCCTAKGESSVLMFLVESWWETKSKLQTIGPMTDGEWSTVELMWWCCVMTAVDKTVEWLLMAWIITIELDCVHFHWASWHYFHTSLNITGLCSVQFFRCCLQMSVGGRSRSVRTQQSSRQTAYSSDDDDDGVAKQRHKHSSRPSQKHSRYLLVSLSIFMLSLVSILCLWDKTCSYFVHLCSFMIWFLFRSSKGRVTRRRVTKQKIRSGYKYTLYCVIAVLGCVFWLNICSKETVVWFLPFILCIAWYAIMWCRLSVCPSIRHIPVLCEIVEPTMVVFMTG